MDSNSESDEDNTHNEPEDDVTMALVEKEKPKFAAGNYVLVKFKIGKIPHHFVGKLSDQIGENSWVVTYYRKTEVATSGKNKEDYIGFKLPETRDMQVTNESEMIMTMKVHSTSRNKIIFKNVFGKKLVR